MAFIKSIISFILAPLLFLGSSNTRVYVAPPVNTLATTTKTESVTATSTKNNTEKKTNISTSTENKKTAQKIATTTKTEVKTEEKQISITPLPAPDFEFINSYARQATINIFCTTKGGSLSPISGTGVVVSKNGLILTNAHIAQYLLIKDFREKDFIQCIARTGSPAYPKYNLELVYISPIWVENNKAILKEQNPKGTGENDFAFLRITSSVDGSTLPENFPFVLMNVREYIAKDQPVLLVSYPAGFLGGQVIHQNLNITSSVTTIKDIFTFKEKTSDLLSVPGTVLSQKGSSGGLVVDRIASLIGMISTSSDGETTSERGLNAITIAYINRSVQKELGITLEELLSQNIPEFAKKFQETNVPGLSKLITDELKTN